MRILIAGGVFRLSAEERGRRQPTPEMVLADGLRSRGVDVVTAPLERRTHMALGNYDLVHVHHLSKAAVAASLSWRSRPLVFTPHGIATLSMRERLGMAVVVRRMAAGICLSETERRMRTAEFSQQLEKFVVIPNGIQGADLIRRRRTRAPHSGLQLLFVGQLVDIKGVHRIALALAAHPSARVRLVYHNDQVEHRLRLLSERLGVRERLTFVGQLSGKALAAEYDRADALVLPSLSEALPSVVAEALLSGLPVVASNTGGVAELVGSAGILTDPRDDHGLSNALPGLQASYEQVASAAYARAQFLRARLSVDGMVSAHMSLYERLVSP